VWASTSSHIVAIALSQTPCSLDEFLDLPKVRWLGESRNSFVLSHFRVCRLPSPQHNSGILGLLHGLHFAPKLIRLIRVGSMALPLSLPLSSLGVRTFKRRTQAPLLFPCVRCRRLVKARLQCYLPQTTFCFFGIFHFITYDEEPTVLRRESVPSIEPTTKPYDCGRKSEPHQMVCRVALIDKKPPRCGFSVQHSDDQSFRQARNRFAVACRP